MQLKAGHENIKKKGMKADTVWAYVFIAPQIFGVLAFVLYPLVFSFLLSFYSWKLIGDPVYVGLENYIKVFKNKIFYEVMWTTLRYTIMATPAALIAGLGLAVMLNRKFRGVSILRTFFYLPTLTCTVAICLVWALLYQRDGGVFNSLLKMFGLTPVYWLGKDWALRSVVIMNTWSTMGTQMVLFLAALKGINTEYYEAARIDGANSFHVFIRITLPMISPTIFYSLCTGFINSIQVFNSVYMLTEGGPGRSTTTVILKIYEMSFAGYEFSKASVWAWALFIIILIVTLIQFRLQKKWVNYDV